MNRYLSTMPDWMVNAKCQVDPYLRVAFANGFVDYDNRALQGKGLIPFTIELANTDADTFIAFKKALKKSQSFCDEIYLQDKSGYVTCHLSKQGMEILHSMKEVKRVELGMPLQVQRGKARSKGLVTSANSPVESVVVSDGILLIGVIDNGCPFAHEAFRDVTGGTRVLSIWDQDIRPDFDTNGPPQGFSYGRYVPRKKLNVMMNAARAANGVINENVCYENAGYDIMRLAQSHGSHTLGLAGGMFSYPALNEQSAVKVGKTKLVDLAAKSDLVFVQLPRQVVQAPTRGSITMHVLNGLRHIVACAGKNVQTIVAVVDYGSDLGPHDAGSMFEKAVDQLVDEVKKSGRSLVVLFPVGNGRQDRRHAGVTNTATATQHLSIWMPPSNEVAVFSEIWFQKPITSVEIAMATPTELIASASKVKLGQTQCIENFGYSVAVIDVSLDSGTGQACVLIRIAPTRYSEAKYPSAEDGRWPLSIKSDSQEEVHMYLMGAVINFGAYKRSKKTHLIPDDTQLDAVSIDTLHTTIGAGCGNKVFMLGSYQKWNLKPTKYSGRGPRRGGVDPNKGPEYLVVGEEGQTLHGIRGIGNRSGATFRLVGTSTAPPQAARVYQQFINLNQQKNSANAKPIPSKLIVDKLDSGSGYLP